MRKAAIAPRRSSRTARAPRGGFTFAAELELRDLLWPLSPRQFLDEYFEQRPLYVRGHADKFAQLFTRALYDRAIEQGVALRADFPPRDDRAGQTFACQLEQIEPLLALGGTICADGLDRRVPRLGRVLDGVKRQLAYPGVVDLRCYLSGDGAGFATHFDARVAMVLQISGKKRWRFSREPGVRDPLTNAVKTVRGFVYTPPLPHEPPLPAPDESRFVEVTLAPGDLLCLPAGTWHEAAGVGESLALTIAFNPCTPTDLFVELLRKSAHGRPGWRRPRPAAPAAEGAAAPTDVALRGPLAEWQALSTTALPELVRLWRQRGLPPRAPSPRPTALTPARRLARVTPLRHFVDGGRLCVYPGGLELERRCQALIEHIARRRELTGAALLRVGRAEGWRWPEVARLLEALFDAGILAVAAER